MTFSEHVQRDCFSFFYKWDEKEVNEFSATVEGEIEKKELNFITITRTCILRRTYIKSKQQKNTHTFVQMTVLENYEDIKLKIGEN